MTTGRPLTVKCFSIFWPAANAVKGVRSKPAAAIGRIALPSFERTEGLRIILIHAPAAFHHHGQDLCLLLVGSGKIVARYLIVRIFLQALAALFDKSV